MNILGSFIICTVIVFIGAIIIFKSWAVIKKRAARQSEAHRHSIQPSFSFYVNKHISSNPAEKGVYIKNIGHGKAVDIKINDFHHPKEKDWHFKFQKTSLLDPGEEVKIDYHFLVGEQTAFNKSDQLWMFDPGHDHDFVAEVIISFSDFEGNAYSQKNRIGKNEHTHDKPRLIKKPN